MGRRPRARIRRGARPGCHLGYPGFEDATRSTVKATDFGVEHWIVSYADTTGATPRGLRISIVIATGHVEVSQFP